MVRGPRAVTCLVTEGRLLAQSQGDLEYTLTGLGDPNSGHLKRHRRVKSLVHASSRLWPQPQAGLGLPAPPSPPRASPALHPAHPSPEQGRSGGE